jgi:tripartite-type tricarboxylate transporter receptor subunit TctC
MAWFRAVLLPLLAAPLLAIAQPYPSKPIHLVVPYPPGGSTDLLARSVAQKVGDSLQQQVIVENRGGGGGTLGSGIVARSAPDGYTILLGTNATHTLAMFFIKGLQYDPVKDFTPLTAAVVVPIALAVHTSVPVNNAREFVEYARQNPTKVSFGSSGTGSPHHLSGELLNQVAGINMVHVPYKGAGPSMQDLVGGQIPAVFTTLSTALPQARNGKIKIIGVVEPKRQPSAPEVPTIGESVPGYAMPVSWLGFFGPAGLPGDIAQRLNKELVRALNDPDTRARLEKGGMPVLATTIDEFHAMIRNDIEAFRRITTAAGIKPE